MQPVSFCSRHKECCNIRHHRRYTKCTVFCEFRNLICRHADVIQPFCRNLLSGTVFHRFFDIISRNIREKSVNPDAYFFRILLFELSLTVDRPAHQPLGVFTAYNSSGHNVSTAWIPFADICNIRNNLIIQRCDRSRFPVSL